MELTPLQTAVLSIPETLNLALLGGRGGGKTTAAVALAIRHLEQNASDAKVLIVRKTLKSLADFEDELLGLAGSITAGEHSFNRAEKVLRWNGGTITLASLERKSDYQDKLQGRSFTLLVVDETTAYSSEKLLRLLRSNLRGPNHVIPRVIYCANPGGPLHNKIYENHVVDRENFVPYELDLVGGDSELWVTVFSTAADNPKIDQEAYFKRLKEACRGDEVRLKQWLHGHWAQGEGALFPAFDASIHVLSDLPPIRDNLFMARGALDWGIAAPSVGLLGARATRKLQLADGRQIPAGSTIVWDECTDAIFGDDALDRSSEWPPDRLAERFISMCSKHSVHYPAAVVDSARGLQGETVLDLMRSTGSFAGLRLPRKGRRAEGWATINATLLAAVEADPNRPHLYLSDSCRYLLATLPFAVRDERDPDDWADTPHCPDHAGDALRYLLAELMQPGATTGRVIGMY